MKTTTYFRGYGSGSPPRQGATRQSGSGGGAMVTERTAHKVEPRAYAANPAAVSQFGGAMGDHAMNSGKVLKGAAQTLVTGPGLMNAGPRPCGEGPGAGRDVMASGGQRGLVRDPTPQQSSHKGWEVPPGERR
jgi:hypothetical protein